MNSVHLDGRKKHRSHRIACHAAIFGSRWPKGESFLLYSRGAGGGPTDREDIFDKTIDFVHDTKIDGAQFTIQTPFPGTKLWEQLNRENRLLLKDFQRDCKRYHGFEAVFLPMNMTAEKIQEGHAFAYEGVAFFKRSLFRAIKTFSNTRSFLGTGISFYWNYEFYKKISREHGVRP